MGSQGYVDAPVSLEDMDQGVDEGVTPEVITPEDTPTE